MTTSSASGSTPASASSVSAARTERSLTCSSSAAMCFPRSPNFSTITCSGMPLRSATSAAVIQRSGRYDAVAPEDVPHAEELSGGHQRPGGHLRVDLAELAARHRLAQSLDVALGELLVVVAQHLRRDELRLADDPVERGMLSGEAEVRAEAEQLRLEARRALRRRVLHRVADPPVQIAHELVEHVLLRREVEVERALADACRLGDLHDRGLVVAELAEDLLRGLDQTGSRLDAARAECPAVGAEDDVGHRTASVTRPCFWIFPRLFRGTSATKRTDFGTLKRASRARHHSSSSSSLTPSATTNATPTSPHCASATPTTAASTTCGCSWRTASTSAG